MVHGQPGAKRFPITLPGKCWNRDADIFFIYIYLFFFLYIYLNCFLIYMYFLLQSFLNHLFFH